MVTTILGGRCSTALGVVVRTIALKEDAQPSLLGCGDDAPWRRMLRGVGTPRGGDDDYIGGRNTLVFQPIAREAGSPADYKQWRRKPACWLLTIGGGVGERSSPT